MGSLQLNPICENSALLNPGSWSLFRVRFLAFDQHVNDLPGKKMTVSAGAPGYEISIHHHVLIGIDGAVSFDISVKIVVRDHPASPHEFRSRCDQPHAMANNSLDDTLFGECSLQKLYRRRKLAHVFGP